MTDWVFRVRVRPTAPSAAATKRWRSHGPGLASETGYAHRKAWPSTIRYGAAVAAGLTVDFLAPVERGDVLTADAVEVSRSGRTGIYDIVVTNRAGHRVALVRGRSATLTGRTVMPVVVANEEEAR